MLLLHEQTGNSQKRQEVRFAEGPLKKQCCPGNKLQAVGPDRGAAVHKDVAFHVPRANINAENNTKHSSTSKMTLRRPAKNVAASASAPAI